MTIFSKRIRINVFLVILLCGIIISLILFKIWRTEEDPKLNSIYGGLFTGLSIGILQLFLSWYEYKEIARIKNLKILDIRYNRDEETFYKKIINKSKNNIDIMGVTANRFINDFADATTDRPEKQALLQAMIRGVSVRILLPKTKFLTESQKSLVKSITPILQVIQEQYADKFSIKYFDHPPAHSIVIIDDKCILGPVFPIATSKDTPSIYLEKSSSYAKKYLDYFEYEWANSTSL